jgi:hypothetical protein
MANFEYVLSNIMMSNDKNRDLYPLRERTICPRQVTTDFYGEIILWLSYEQYNRNSPVNYWEFGGKDYIHPNFNPAGIVDGITYDECKIGTRSLRCEFGYNTTLSNMTDEFDIGLRGRFGTWMKTTTASASTELLGFSSIAGGELRTGLLKSESGVTFSIYIDESMIHYNFPWVSDNNTWYFIEFAYDFTEGGFAEFTASTDSGIVYNERLNVTMPITSNKISYISIGYVEFPLGLFLDNTMLSTNPNKSLYPIRNETSCPKGPSRQNEWADFLFWIRYEGTNWSPVFSLLDPTKGDYFVNSDYVFHSAQLLGSSQFWYDSAIPSGFGCARHGNNRLNEVGTHFAAYIETGVPAINMTRGKMGFWVKYPECGRNPEAYMGGGEGIHLKVDYEGDSIIFLGLSAITDNGDYPPNVTLKFTLSINGEETYGYMQYSAPVGGRCDWLFVEGSWDQGSTTLRVNESLLEHGEYTTPPTDEILHIIVGNTAGNSQYNNVIITQDPEYNMNTSKYFDAYEPHTGLVLWMTCLNGGGGDTIAFERFIQYEQGKDFILDQLCPPSIYIGNCPENESMFMMNQISEEQQELGIPGERYLALTNRVSFGGVVGDESDHRRIPNARTVTQGRIGFWSVGGLPACDITFSNTGDGELKNNIFIDMGVLDPARGLQGHIRDENGNSILFGQGDEPWHRYSGFIELIFTSTRLQAKCNGLVVNTLDYSSTPLGAITINGVFHGGTTRQPSIGANYFLKQLMFTEDITRDLYLLRSTLNFPGYTPDPREPLRTTSVRPRLSEENVPLDTQIIITFNLNINETSVNSTTFKLYNDDAIEIPGTFSVDGIKVTFTPDALLEITREYIILLSKDGIASTTGKRLSAEFRSVFNT